MQLKGKHHKMLKYAGDDERLQKSVYSHIFNIDKFKFSFVVINRDCAQI